MKTEIDVGNALLAQRQFEDANAHFARLAEKHPTHAAPVEGMLRVARTLGDRPTVRTHLKALLKITPNAIFPRSLELFFNAWNDLEAAHRALPELFKLARAQSVSPHVADTLMRTVQYVCIGSSRFEYLHQIRQLIEDRQPLSAFETAAKSVLLSEMLLAVEDYEALVPAVKELSQDALPNPLHSRVQALTRVCAKITAPDFPDFSASKIFGIGLSRTGTTSLNSALNQLGYHAVHWLNPITRNLLSQDDYVLFDAFSDINASQHFEWLYHTFPNSKFVLTTRDVTPWTTSVTSHYRRLHEMENLADLSEVSAKKRFAHRAGSMDANLYAHHASWAEAHDAYHSRVADFFASKPSHRLVQMDITKGEGWDVLCPFLDVARPDGDFPSLNSTKRKEILSNSS